MHCFGSVSKVLPLNFNYISFLWHNSLSSRKTHFKLRNQYFEERFELAEEASKPLLWKKRIEVKDDVKFTV